MSGGLGGGLLGLPGGEIGFVLGLAVRVFGEGFGPCLVHGREGGGGGEGAGVHPRFDARAAPVAADDADGDSGKFVDVLGEVVANGGKIPGGGGRGDLPGFAINGDRIGGGIGDDALDLDVTDERETRGGGDIDGLVVGVVEMPFHVGLAGGEPHFTDDNIG